MAKRNTPLKEKKDKPPKKEKKAKAKKDKNAPKRAISAFFFYQKERRETLKKEQTALDNKQLISKMSEEWNNMNDSQRTAYSKLAELDKARYEREKKEYEKTKVSATAITHASKPTTGNKAISTTRKNANKKKASDEDDENNESD
jgi:hypothetical protein